MTKLDWEKEKKKPSPNLPPGYLESVLKYKKRHMEKIVTADTRSAIEKRNWKIYFEWIGGKNYDVLAKEFGLVPNTVEGIIHKKIPYNVRQTPWQSRNQYEKYRAWKRNQMLDKSVGKPNRVGATTE